MRPWLRSDKYYMNGAVYFQFDLFDVCIIFLSRKCEVSALMDIPGYLIGVICLARAFKNGGLNLCKRETSDSYLQR